MKQAIVDFETDGIEDRPEYPPVPRSVGIWADGKYIWKCWGHPTGNNCTKADARRTLKKYWRKYRCVFHNCAFDIDVGETHLGLGFPVEYDDTEFLAFLHDPRDPSLALKKLAEKYLDMPPDEQDELREWIVENYMKPNGLKKLSQWGAYICKAPGDLVGKYCKGDLIRTKKLLAKFRPYIVEHGMLDAYERELKLVRTKLRMERHGVNTAHNRIKKDLPKFRRAHENTHKRIYKRLGITPEYEAECPKGFFNMDSNEQLADALEDAGIVSEWYLTDKGNRSTSADNLRAVIDDQKFLRDWEIYSVLTTYLNTFLQPWHDIGARSDGFIFPTFNQVRTVQDHGNFKGKGTKTGRPSVSNPNFNNLPANVEESKNAKVLKEVYKYLRGYGLNFIGLRDYITPSPGNCLIGRDYQQQEVRVLAHYEDGALLQQYLDDPRLDIHNAVRSILIKTIGVTLPRKAVKTVAFGIMYGFGLDALAEELETTRDEAQRIKRAYMKALPGISDLNSGLKSLDDDDSPLYTIGGRMYYTEAPKIVDGRLRTYGYKNLNLLIQGGSADITKEAMLRFEDTNPKGQLILQVYDELVIDTPDPKHDMPRLRYALETSFADELDVPMPTDGEYSRVSWGRMKPFKEPKNAKQIFECQ